MYIEITQAYADALDASGIGPMWEILTNIHIALRKGAHIIVCEKSSVAEVIVKKASKRADILSDFASIETEVSRELRILRSSLNRYYSLVPSLNTDYAQTGKKIEIGIDVASNDCFWKEANLVVEFSTDYICYKMIADYEKSKDPNICTINIAFNPVSGGGHTSLDVFENIRQKKEIVFGIVDSDYDYDGGPLGSTAQAYEMCSSAKSILSDYIILGVRELENLFYSSSFIDGLDFNQTLKSSIEQKMRCALRHDPKFELFYDIKSGYTRKSVALKPALMAILETTACCSDANERNCKKCKEPVCNTNIMKGFGGDFIKKIRAKYCGSSAVGNFFRDAELKNSNLDDEWSKLGRCLFEWGCGLKMNSRRV